MRSTLESLNARELRPSREAARKEALNICRALLACALALPWVICHAGCPAIDGYYRHKGHAKSKDGDRPDTLLQRLSRPSRANVEFARIQYNEQSSDLSASFLDAALQPVGDSVRLAVRCEGASWVERDNFDGNSDGTPVQGERVWRYSLNQNGDLVVDSEVSGTATYFLWFKSPIRGAGSTVFPKYVPSVQR